MGDILPDCSNRRGATLRKVVGDWLSSLIFRQWAFFHTTYSGSVSEHDGFFPEAVGADGGDFGDYDSGLYIGSRRQSPLQE
jgi:hypothetical protein